MVGAPPPQFFANIGFVMQRTKTISRRSSVSKALLCAVLIGIGCASQSPEPDEAQPEKAATKAQQEPEAVQDSDIIPVGESPQKGADDAWVTVVVFADFQCPFCAQLAATLDEVEQEFDDKMVRVVFKHFPLDGRAETSRGALAAEAAAEQGKFWEMHDALFDAFNDLSGDHREEVITEAAASIGLDQEQFRRDMQSRKIVERIDDDRRLAEQLGLRGVPAVFINGGFISGAHPAPVYRTAIANVAEVLQHGVANGEMTREEVYRSSVETLYDQTADDDSEEPEPDSVVEVPVDGDRPQTGELDDATVNVGAFLSFGDEPSRTFHRQLHDIAASNDDVRVVYFHLLHDDDEAIRLAHRALEGANTDDEVRLLVNWLHDEANDWRNEPGLLENFLDDRDIAPVDDDQFDAVLKADYEIAEQMGVYGTPTSFVNGIRLVGVPRAQKLADVVEEQRALARRVAEIEDLSGHALYRQMVEGNIQRNGGE